MATIDMADLKPGDALIIKVMMFGREETYGIGIYDRVEPSPGEVVDWPTLKSVMSLSFGPLMADWQSLPAKGLITKGQPVPWYLEAEVISASKNGEVVF